MTFGLERKFYFVGFHKSEDFSNVYGMDMKRPDVNMYKQVLVRLFANEDYNLDQGDIGGDTIKFVKMNTSILLEDVSIEQIYRNGETEMDDQTVLRMTVSGRYSLDFDPDSKEKMKEFYKKFDDVGENIDTILTDKFLQRDSGKYKISLKD